MKLIEKLDIFPFTRIFWKRKNDRVMNLMQRVSRVCHFAEYETVRRRLRKACTFHIEPVAFEDQVERIANDGLYWLPIKRSKKYEGFSHKHFPTNKADPDSTVYGVLSWKLDYAREFKEASKGKVDHKKIAQLLGYPPCCIKFFDEVWTAGFYDPIWQAAENTEGSKRSGNTIELETNAYPNESKPYFGLRLVPQLTCSFRCQASEKQAKIFVDVMRKTDKEVCEFLVDYLKGPMTWSVLHGIAQVETEDLLGITNSMPTREKYTVNVRRKQ